MIFCKQAPVLSIPFFAGHSIMVCIEGYNFSIDKVNNLLFAKVSLIPWSPSTSTAALDRKHDPDVFEYYDVQEPFKKNAAAMKSGVIRKKLSQINEESTVDGTPLTNSRWSSSLSNFSGKTLKFDSDEVDNDIWSDIDSKNQSDCVSLGRGTISRHNRLLITRTFSD